MPKQIKEPEWLWLMESNCWIWKHPDEDGYHTHKDYNAYCATIYGDWNLLTVTAWVAEGEDGLSASGSWGVAWIEADTSPYTEGADSWDDTVERQMAIVHAEDNLLRCGIPFVEDYDFHGKNIAQKHARNIATRRKLRLNEAETAFREERRKNANQ